MKVSVCVFRPKDRPCYQAQWTDPETGRKKTRSTGERTKRAALKFAAKLEADIHAGRFRARRRIKWQDFRERYETESVASKRPKTREKVASTFNMLERLERPAFLTSIDAATISGFATKLRKAGRTEATVKGHLAHLKVALRWAERIDLIDKVPRIDMPRKTAAMNGRPITGEEFERMLAAAPRVVARPLLKKRTRLVLKLARSEAKPVDDAGQLRAELRDCNAEIRRVVASWRYLLRGLWWSGLRLSEALALDWIDDRLLCVDFSGRRPMLRIQADGQKSGKNTTLPMAPEFAEFLLATPEAERSGRVFDPLSCGINHRSGPTLRLDTVSSMICRIGKAATVKVAERGRGETRRVKFASAHDLRRSFGFRWSTRVMPPVLQQLMRHSSITTTMEYYVGRNAESAADALWEAVASDNGRAVANDSANTRPIASPAETVATPQVIEK